MNFTPSSNYNEALNSNVVYHLEEGFDKLSVENYVTDEGVEDEVLYVTRQGIVTEDFCGAFETNIASADDSVEWTLQTPSEDSGLNCPIGELAPEDVRWFYKSETDKQWLPFSGYDSLRIEERYRQLRLRLPMGEVSCQLSGSSSPMGERRHSGSTGSMDDSVYYDASSTCSSEPDPACQSTVKDHIVVRGGMYEVDVDKRKCASIFWPGEQSAIIRGTWFYHGSWQPLEGDRNDDIDSVHMELFANKCAAEYSSMANSKLPKAVIHSESFSEFRVDWYSPFEVYLFSEAAPSKLVRSFTQKLGYFQKSAGYRLYRGFNISAKLDDRPLNVTHLVFVIHGIGQKMDKDRIIRNTCTFRENTTSLQTKCFPSSKQRVEFFPVEWRSSLKLDGGIVEAITPNKVQSIRQRLNATAMDIMFYTSPLYSQEIQQGLACELNRLYSTFTQRNPDFAARGGKVSIIAHSLGCVIVYDIVTGWSITHTLEQRKQAQESSISAPNGGVEVTDSGAGAAAGGANSPRSSQDTTPTPTPTHKPTNLLFQLDNLFCLGSPLAVFLALRVRDPQAASCHKDLLPPTLCNRFYNIFYPSDPVAYRMEPLLVREYARVAPLLIQAYNASTHSLYSDMPLEVIVPDTAATTAASARQTADEGDSPKSPGGTPSRERGWSLWSIVRGGWKAQDDSGSPQLDSPSQGLEHRLDYALHDKHIAGPYISAITSHTAYWYNYDVAYFVLTRIFPELEQEAIMSTNTSTSVQMDPNQHSPQQSPQQPNPRVASPPLLQQMLSQVQNQAQSILQMQPPSLPVPSPTSLQRKGSNEAASR